MRKNTGYGLVFTSNDIERIAKNSTAEVATKQIVTVGTGGRHDLVVRSGTKAQAPSPKGVYKVIEGRTASSKASGQTKALAGSVLSQSSKGYSSKQAVDMLNQAFKKVKA